MMQLFVFVKVLKGSSEDSMFLSINIGADSGQLKLRLLFFNLLNEALIKLMLWNWIDVFFGLISHLECPKVFLSFLAELRISSLFVEVSIISKI